MARAGTHVRIGGYDPFRSWPSRARKLRAFTSAIKPDFVIAYGVPAGERVCELFDVVSSTFDGATATWHQLPGIGTIAKT